jgi:hypothetical protein
LPLACRDILANGFRIPLYRLGGHFQIGQQFHLLAAVSKGSLLAHHRLPAPHPGRNFAMLDVQFDIGRELAGRTAGAQVIGTRHLHLAHHGEHRLGAQLPVVSLVRTSTREGSLVGGRGFEVQQPAQGCGSGLMHGRAHCHLDGFQIQTGRLAASVEDNS